MRLPNIHIDSFIKLYERKFGVVLERNEATSLATKLVKCIEVVESNAITSSNVQK